MFDTGTSNRLQDFSRILHEIHEKAGKMKTLTEERLGTLNPSNRKQQPASLDFLYPIPTLSLSFPDDIESSVRVSSFSHDTCTETIQKIHHSIESLQRIYARNFENSCRQILTMPLNQHAQSIPVMFDKLRTAYETSYANRALEMKIRALEIIKGKVERNRSRKRGTFNTKYIPLLERYFASNAYPSAEHRRVLARRTSLTPRQIEVWFQNHRNRAKKDRGQVNRLESTQSLLHRLGLLGTPEDMSARSRKLQEGQIRLETEELSDDDSYCSENGLDVPEKAQHFAFDVRAPHAYPAKYPPNFVHDPFPSENGIFKFSPPVWLRKPATSACVTSQISMDEFISLFAAKLSLRECNSKKQINKLPHRSMPWFSSTITRPPPAPLPSLIRSSCSRPKIQMSGVLRNAVQENWHSLTSSCRSATSTFMRTPPATTKKARLLKRLPQSSPVTSPPWPSDLNSPSKPPSATFSLPSRSRTSSASSFTSDGSLSRPVTPVDCDHLRTAEFGEEDFKALDELFGSDPSSALRCPLQAYDSLVTPLSKWSTSQSPYDFLFDLSSHPLHVIS